VDRQTDIQYEVYLKVKRFEDVDWIQLAHEIVDIEVSIL
jgi:hypothetical protein